jgi:hypothetical protein
MTGGFQFEIVSRVLQKSSMPPLPCHSERSRRISNREI